MKNSLIPFLIILFFFLNTIQAQEFEDHKKPFFLILAGGNYSTFLHSNSDWDYNYTLGFLLEVEITEKFKFTPLISYSKSSAFVRNLKGIFISWDNIYYRTYNDLEFKASFIELELLFNYTIYKYNHFNLIVGLGPGYSIAQKDYSNSVNLRYTDEIIYDGSQSTPSVDHSTDPFGSFASKNNGFTFGSNLMLNYKRLNISILYTIKMFKIKEIEQLHSFTLLFGFWF